MMPFARIGVLVAAMAPLAALSAYAQETPRVLTWQDCLAIASQNSPELASSTLGLEASRASYFGSYNGLLPQFGFSNSYNDSNTSEGYSRWNLGASASLNLLNMGQIASVRSASAFVEQSKASLRQASANLRQALRSDFAQLLFAQEIVGVSRSIRDLRDKDSRLVTLRYDSGRESKGNMMRSKAQLMQAQADLDQDLRGLRTAQKTLAGDLGLDDFQLLAATGTLEAPPAPPQPADMSALVAARPDVALQESVVRGSRASLSQARSTLYPTVGLNYSRNVVGHGEPPYERYGWSFTGTLSYPLFGGGPTQTWFASSAASKRLAASLEDLRSVRNQAVVDLQTTWAGYAGAMDQTKVQASLLEAARLRNDEADVRYESGLMTFENWELIVSDRVGLERSAIRALLSAAQAEAAWNKSLGKGLGE